jgi:YihY family inner membrane protein
MFALARHLVRRARQERLPQTAGSLTFTTVLSTVPLLAVSLALFARWPMLARFEAAFEDLLFKSLLPSRPRCRRAFLARDRGHVGDAAVAARASAGSAPGSRGPRR